MKRPLLQKAAICACVFLLVAISASSQTSTPKKQNRTTTSQSAAEYELEGGPTPYIFPFFAEPGSFTEDNWTVAEHIHNIWRIKSSEKITVGAKKIQKIEHVNS